MKINPNNTLIIECESPLEMFNLQYALIYYRGTLWTWAFDDLLLFRKNGDPDWFKASQEHRKQAREIGKIIKAITT